MGNTPSTPFERELLSRVARLEEQMRGVGGSVAEVRRIAMDRHVTPIPPPVPWHASAYSLSSDLTFTERDLFRIHNIEISGSRNLNLPTAVGGGWVVICNSGTGTGTLKDGGTTLCSIVANTYALVYCIGAASQAVQWPDSVPVLSLSGKQFMRNDVVFDAGGHAPVVKDNTDGNWYRLETAAGVLSTNNLGGTAPTN
jgi:hypothetical protein